MFIKYVQLQSSENDSLISVVLRHFNSVSRINVAFFCSPSFRRIHTLIGHRAEISSAQFNWDCSLIATGSMDKTSKIWDATTGE